MTSTTARRSPLYFFAAVLLAIAALRLMRDILIPLALATLITFLLAPLIVALERRFLCRVSSVLLVTLLSFGVLLGIGWGFTNEVATIASNVPQYTDNLRSRVKVVRGAGTAALAKIKRSFESVNREIEGTPPVKPDERDSTVRAGAPAVPEAGTSLFDKPLSLIPTLVQPVVGPLGLAFLVTILVIFMLIQREDLRDRAIRILGEGRLHVTTEVLDEAAERMSRFLAIQFAINFAYGLSVAAGLWMLGIPNAGLWGVLSGVLRFVPYVGAWIAAAFPIFLSLATSSGWALPFATLSYFVALEFLMGNVVEPYLFGHMTGLSPFGVLLAAVVWSWLWGGVGLLLSTPLTVSLVVFGKYVPSLRFMTILFGDEPPLLPHVRLYQRLLAFDQEEAAKITQRLMETATLTRFYEQVLIPAIAMAEEDLNRGVVDDRKRDPLLDGFNLIASEAYEFAKKGKEEEVTENGHTQTSQPVSLRILIVPSRDKPDEIAGSALSYLLRAAAHHVTPLSSTSLVTEMNEYIQAQAPDVVIFSAVSMDSLRHARYMLKRIGGEAGTFKVLVGFWSDFVATEKIREEFRFLKQGVTIVRTFSDALAEVSALIPIAAAEDSAATGAA